MVEVEVKGSETHPSLQFCAAHAWRAAAAEMALTVPDAKPTAT